MSIKRDDMATGSPDETPFTTAQWRVAISHVGDELRRRLDATESECAALADALDVIACTQVLCDVNLKPGRRGRFIGTLRVQARFVQNCVVTLEPFDTQVDDTVDVEFWPAAQIEVWDSSRGAEAEVDDETPDPEAIIDDKLNVGMLAYQFLAMAVDPHPRKPDAAFGAVSTQSDAERAAEHPFAALAKLRNDAPDA